MEQRPSYGARFALGIALGLPMTPPVSILARTATIIAFGVVAIDSNAWPITGTRVYYNAPIVSERCIVPLSLWEAKDSGALSCADYPANKIFQFNEALAGTRVELSFKGNIVTGQWLTDNRNVGNDLLVQIELAGQTFVTKDDSGGKVDGGPIRGSVKCGVIYAHAKSEGHNPEAGFVGIVMTETPTGLSWRATGKGVPPGYMPEREVLYSNRDGVVSDKDGWPNPSIHRTCAKSRAGR